MNVDEIREYCLAKENVEECLPFDDVTLVFKVNGKMFLLVGLNEVPVQFNVKCDPERALALREEFENIQPGYHMNKKHWNTVVVDRSLSRKILKEQIDHSYSLVAAGKSAKKKR